MPKPERHVYPERVMYAKVQRQQVGDIFEQHLERGEPIESLKVSPEFW